MLLGVIQSDMISLSKMDAKSLVRCAVGLIVDRSDKKDRSGDIASCKRSRYTHRRYATCCRKKSVANARKAGQVPREVFTKIEIVDSTSSRRLMANACGAAWFFERASNNCRTVMPRCLQP